YVVPTGRGKVPTRRIKVPAGRYVVPTSKDNVIVSDGRSKVIPAGRTILVLVKFLRSKDEAPDFIIKFLKMIQVRLKVPV
ncbi:hypothetical protein Tco_0147528, partial [Tanacetum coccineum]